MVWWGYFQLCGVYWGFGISGVGGGEAHGGDGGDGDGGSRSWVVVWTVGLAHQLCRVGRPMCGWNQVYVG